MTGKVVAHTENVVDLDEAWLFVIRDNVDSLFFSYGCPRRVVSDRKLRREWR